MLEAMREIPQSRHLCDDEASELRHFFGDFLVVAATELKQSVLERTDRYRVTVEQYVTFRTRGFVVIPQLVAPAEVEELRQHTEDLMQGRLPQQSRQMNERDLEKDHGVTCQDL